MTSIRIFDPSYVFTLDGGPVSAQVAGKPTQQRIILETTSEFATDLSGATTNEPIFIRLLSDPGALFAGSPEGYSGRIARVTVFRGTVEDAEAGRPEAVVYDIRGVEGLSLDGYISGNENADALLFGGRDRIWLDGRELRLSSNLVDLLRRDEDAGPLDLVLGGDDDDRLVFDAEGLSDPLDVLIGRDEGVFRVFSREMAGSDALRPIVDLAGVEQLDFGDTVLEPGAATVRRPFAVDPRIGNEPEITMTAMEDGARIELHAGLLANSLGFRVVLGPEDATAPVDIGSVDDTGTRGILDFDPAADSLTYRATNFDFLAEGQPSSTTFTYTVTDGVRDSARATVTVPIRGADDPVVIDNEASITTGGVIELANVTDGGTNLMATGEIAFSDKDLRDIHQAESDLALSTPTTTAMTTDGTVTWTYSVADSELDWLAEGEQSTETSTITISDTRDLSSASTNVTITLVGSNDLPIIGPEPTLTGEVSELMDGAEGEGTEIHRATGSIPFTDADLRDTQSAAITARDEGYRMNLALTQPETDETTTGGTVGWTFSVRDAAIEALGADESVTATYEITITDDQGATATEEVSITINGVNDAPECLDDTAAVNANALLPTVDIPRTDLPDLLANDTDIDVHDTLTVVSIGRRDGDVVVGVTPVPATGDAVTFSPAAGGELTVRSDGRFSFDPDGDFDDLRDGETEEVVFSYTVSDGNGGMCSADLTITVTGVNDAPECMPDTAAVTEGETVIIDVLANDRDPEDGTVGLRIASVTQPAHGRVSIIGNELVYEPGSDFPGLAVGETTAVTFSYVPEDADGLAGMPCTVTVTVTGRNTCPEVTDDTRFVTASSASALIDVLGNDFDPDGDVLSLVAIDTSGISGGGSARIEGNAIRFDPGTAYDGLAQNETVLERVSYTITDGRGCEETGTLTITVGGRPNRCPEPIDDSRTISGVLGSHLFDVLSNDLDPDGDPLTIVSVARAGADIIGGGSASDDILVAEGALGAATVENGQIRYVPGNVASMLLVGQTLVETFTYTISDGTECREEATLTVTIEGTVADTLLTTFLADDGLVGFDALPESDTLLDLSGTAADSLEVDSPGLLIDGFSSDGLVIGGAGTDTVSYDLLRAELTESLGGDGVILVIGPTGRSETLVDIERIQLLDGVYRYDLSDSAPGVYRLYSAAFGRAPDEAGLLYWASAASGQLSELDLADAFVSSLEFTDRFGGEDPPPDVLIDAFYLNVLGREADPAGDAFWTDQLDAGLTVAEMLLDFAESPENLELTEDDTDGGVWALA